MSNDRASRDPRELAIDRRTFVGALAALLATSRPLLGAPHDAGTVAAVGLGQTITTMLTDRRAAARIGRRYLAEHPNEQDGQWLHARLSAALSEQGLSSEVGAASHTFAAALETLILTEYRSQPLQPVDGWLLAPSEARLSALVALMAPS
jgi:hypothetical protein